MEDALRLVTLSRGVDPRECALMAFGGAGPTHAARLAEAFDVNEVVVPRIPGLFSTFGLLTSDVVHEEVRTIFLEFEAAGNLKTKAAAIVRDGIQNMAIACRQMNRCSRNRLAGRVGNVANEGGSGRMQEKS